MTVILSVRPTRVRRRRPVGAPDVAPPDPARVPRIARMLALAHCWRGLIRAGVVKDQAALARLVGVSRARVTQVMDLLYLAPDIQEEILVTTVAGVEGVRHRNLLPIAATADWSAQRRRWNAGQRT